jgi:hypothetical protein
MCASEHPTPEHLTSERRCVDYDDDLLRDAGRGDVVVDRKAFPDRKVHEQPGWVV